MKELINDMDANHSNISTLKEKLDENYDLILLKGCGQTTQWKFPAERTSCPVTNCLEQFEDRVTAIEHYKKNHTQKSILCYLCNAPMVVWSDKDFENHYRRIHPDVEMPVQFNQKIKQEPSTKNVCVSRDRIRSKQFNCFD